MGLWIADARQGVLTPTGRCAEPAAPLCLCVCGSAVICAGQREARVFAAEGGPPVAAFALPPAARCMCALPGALYCLSGEADSVSVLCPRTGQLRLCARAGCDPRDMTLSPDSRLLAVAGGASGKLYLFDSPALTPLRSIALPGVVYAVCFRGAELYALCAIENGEVSTCLYRVSARGVVSEGLHLPGLPGSLLTLPGGDLLVGALGQLLHLRADMKLLRRFPCGLPARLRLYRDHVLCVDPLEGRALRLLPREGLLQTLYAGEAADAVVV